MFTDGDGKASFNRVSVYDSEMYYSKVRFHCFVGDASEGMFLVSEGSDLSAQFYMGDEFTFTEDYSRSIVANQEFEEPLTVKVFTRESDLIDYTVSAYISNLNGQ